MKRELPAVVLLVMLVAALAVFAPRGLQPQSIQSVLLYLPLLLVVGLGEMPVIVTRGIDVSVGSIVGCSAIAAGLVFQHDSHPNLWAAGAVAVGCGLVLGCVNGVLVAKLKVPPIIATLGALSGFRGLAFIASQGKQVDSSVVPDALNRLSSVGPVSFGGVSLIWTDVLALVMAGLVALALSRLRFGRDIYALGSNPNAALLRGIPVDRIRFAVYAFSGLCAGFGGLLYISQYGFANPGTAGQGLELVVIAAVAIGGVDVSGGFGTVLGVFLGCTLLAWVNAALSVVGISENWQQLVYGALILLAVLSELALRRRRKPTGEAGR